MNSNDMSEHNGDVICVWPDGSYCDPADLEAYLQFKDANYKVVKTDEFFEDPREYL